MGVEVKEGFYVGVINSNNRQLSENQYLNAIMRGTGVEPANTFVTGS